MSDTPRSSAPATFGAKDLRDHSGRSLLDVL